MTHTNRPSWIDGFIEYTERIMPPKAESEPFNSYVCGLDLSLTDLFGKKILDVGSGRGLFGSTLKQLGIAKFVVNLDDGFVVKAMDVQGKAESLPFKNESLISFLIGA